MFSVLLKFISPCVRIGLINVPIPSACAVAMPGCSACTTASDCSQCDNDKIPNTQCTGKLSQIKGLKEKS